MKQFNWLFLLNILLSTTVLGQGRIYFSGGSTSPKVIVSMDPDGGDLRSVTPAGSPRDDYQPHVSPDGKWVAFNSYRYGGWKLAVATIDGKNMRRLTDGSAYQYDAHWSPDGKMLTYVGFTSGRNGRRQVFRVGINDKKPVQLTNESFSHYSPSFVEGGKRILFIASAKDQFDVFTMTLEGKDKKNLTNTSDVHELAPTISPDGKHLAYYSVNEKSEIQLVIHDLKSGEKKVIYRGWNGQEVMPEMDTPIFPYSISWSPDSERLVFSSYFGGRNFEIVRIDRSGENRKRLTNSDSFDSQPHWSAK